MQELKVTKIYESILFQRPSEPSPTLASLQMDGQAECAWLRSPPGTNWFQYKPKALLYFGIHLGQI